MRQAERDQRLSTGLTSDERERLKDLDRENQRLKKLVAELSLGKAMLEEVAKGTGELRATPERGQQTPGYAPLPRCQECRLLCAMLHHRCSGYRHMVCLGDGAGQPAGSYDSSPPSVLDCKGQFYW